MAYRPEHCSLEHHGATIVFRTRPSQLRYWLRRIDAWIECVNSVVEE